MTMRTIDQWRMLCPITEVALDGGGGSPKPDDSLPVPEGFVKDFITNQVLKFVKAKFNDIKKAFLSGDTAAIKDVVNWLIAKLKEHTGIVVSEESVMAVVEFVLSLFTVKDDLPKALKEGGELLIAASAFLKAKPLYATIVRQVGELLVAVSVELGNKPVLVGDSGYPDDRFGSAIEDFEDIILATTRATAEPEFGIIEVITIGRLLFEAIQWWRRRRQEKATVGGATANYLVEGEVDPDGLLDKPTGVLFIKCPGQISRARRSEIEEHIESKTGFTVIALDGGLEIDTIVG